jgi:hypothetical protein
VPGIISGIFAGIMSELVARKIIWILFNKKGLESLLGIMSGLCRKNVWILKIIWTGKIIWTLLRV